MNPSQPSRRLFLSLPVGALAALTLSDCTSSDDKPKATAFPAPVTVPSNRQAEPAAFVAKKTVSITDHGGDTKATDNSAALTAAFTAAGAHGEVTIPAGTFSFTQTIAWPGATTRVRGLGSAQKPTTVKFAAAQGNGLSATGSGIGGSSLENVVITGASSAQLFIQGAPGQQFSVVRCTFVDAPTYGIQVQDAYLHLRDCTFMGPADGTMTAVHGLGAGTKVTARQTTITGCFRGLYCAGVGDLTADQLTIDAMWWSGNAKKFGSSLAAVTDKSAQLKSSVSLPQSTGYTLTAWEKVGDQVTLTPVGGKAGWFTVSGGVALEPRLMFRTADTWATALEVSGRQVHLPSFYEWSTCHPTAAFTSATSGVTVERPYIASITKLDGTSATVQDRWKAGAKSETKTPPVGARVTVTPVLDYQIFGTDGTKSFSATGCTIRNSWADSISTIASSNAYVARNTIWDSQDVGVTIQQGTGPCRVEHNTMHRIGTAGVFIGTSGSQVNDNTIVGAQHTAYREDSYGPLQIEGAEKVAVWNNSVTWGGSPYEVRGMIIEGRYGPFPTTNPTKGPFATDGHYKGNEFHGYPATLSIPQPSTEPDLQVAEVTVRGAHASAASASWGKIRVQALDGASKSHIRA